MGTEPSVSPIPPPDVPAPSRRAVWGRLIFLAFTLIALYVLWPSLLKVFSAWPELLRLAPEWFVVMLGLEVASFVCVWGLQRIALRSRSWFGVATAQLAGNAVSRLVPGGAAAGGAVQFGMLVADGVEPAQVGTGLTVASLISTATLLILPLLSVPAVLLGRPVPSGLAQAAWLGGAVFVVAFGFGWMLLANDRAILAVGRVIGWVANRTVRGGRPPKVGTPERLLSERNQVADDLQEHWWKALLFALGNWLFDYLALLAALTAVGSHPRPTLVLLAYVASMILGMIPITPGGLGFVEAGLTALLALAGVHAADAVTATLAYRLVSYWLPLPAGGVAGLLHARRARRAAPAQPSTA